MTPRLIDLKTATDAELLPLHEFWLARRAEILPEDPPIPWSERSKGWREPPTHLARKVFVIQSGNEIIAIADADWRTNDLENPESGWLDLFVAPGHLRQGIGSKLLLTLLEEVYQLGRRKLFTSTTNIRPGGKPFAELFGAKFGQEEHTNQLLLSELNLEYLQTSINYAPTAKYELVWYENTYTDDETEQQKICDAFEIMNTAPRGELEFNDWKMTPKKLQEDAENARKNETQWWLCLAKNLETGIYDGFTETGWHPNRPTIANQYGTGVHPNARGSGLGAWLKAAMIQKILHERPSVDRIRTGNADSNEPMLKINHSLGFKPFLDRIEWQIDVAKTLEILRNRT
jgi:mycothiol synthase